MGDITLVEGDNVLNVGLTPIVPEIIDGELLRGLAWWEGLPEWETITHSNAWPANTAIVTQWDIKNTGNVTATFKVVFMGEQGSIQLNPGESGNIKFTVNTGGPGSYSYTWNLYGNDVLLETLTIGVIVIAPIANLYGIVTDAQTGSPLSGVKVTIDGVTTYTDASGNYGFEGLSPGSYTITFEKDGYETVTR